jgi:hypothetical protein
MFRFDASCRFPLGPGHFGRRLGSAGGPGSASDLPVDVCGLPQSLPDDLAFQRAAVANPLIDSHTSGAEVNSKTISIKRPVAQLQWPIIPSAAERRKEKLEMVVKVDATHRDRRSVTVRTPESDAFQMIYTFRKRGCWTLIQRYDGSL